jgi:hypothetical protein
MPVRLSIKHATTDILDFSLDGPPDGSADRHKVETLEPWQPRAIVLSRFSAEPAFSAAALFGTFVL